MVVGGELQMPRRKVFTNKVLPKFDNDLDLSIRQRIDGIIKHTGVTLISDGWSSVANKPIINALVSSPVGSYFIEALDTSGETKDAQYIADFINGHIDMFGAEQVTAVCMDGACKASFPIIEAKHTHVSCFFCPTHSLDNFMKNVCSDKDKITIKGDERVFDWGVHLFSDAIEQVCKSAPPASYVHAPPLQIVMLRSAHPPSAGLVRCGMSSNLSLTTTSRWPSTARSAMLWSTSP